MLFILLGLSMGSFVNAWVWRLRENRNWWSERSECTSCHHVLAWYDLVPVMSWLSLKGKCRYCDKKISRQYPIVELIVAGLFVASYLLWPLPLDSVLAWAYFGLFLFAIVIAVALTLYDLKWYELPDALTATLAVSGLIMIIIRECGSGQCQDGLPGVQMVLALLPIAGLYGLLHAMSRGAWVGMGDVKLGIGLGLMLGWQQAILAVFLANLIGMLFVLPGLIAGKVRPKSNIPFGPFLLAGWFVAMLFGNALIRWYIDMLGIV